MLFFISMDSRKYNERKDEYKRYEARNCGHSSPDSLAFEPAKCADDRVVWEVNYGSFRSMKYPSLERRA